MALKSALPGKGDKQVSQPSANKRDIAKGTSTDSTKLKRLQPLISLETSVRRAAGVKELAYIMANESRNVVFARQVFVLQQTRNDKYRLSAIS